MTGCLRSTRLPRQHAMCSRDALPERGLRTLRYCSSGCNYRRHDLETLTTVGVGVAPNKIKGSAFGLRVLGNASVWTARLSFLKSRPRGQSDGGLCRSDPAGHVSFLDTRTQRRSQPWSSAYIVFTVHVPSQALSHVDETPRTIHRIAQVLPSTPFCDCIVRTNVVERSSDGCPATTIIHHHRSSPPVYCARRPNF